MSKKSIVIHIVGAAIILLGLVESINYNRKVLSRANNIEPMDLVSWGIGIMISLAIALLLVAGIYGMKSIYALYCKVAGTVTGIFLTSIRLASEHISMNMQSYLEVLVSFTCMLLFVIFLLLYVGKVTNMLVTMIVTSICCVIPRILSLVEFVQIVGLHLGYCIGYVQFLIQILLNVSVIVAIIWCVENDRKAEAVVEKNNSEQ